MANGSRRVDESAHAIAELFRGSATLRHACRSLLDLLPSRFGVDRAAVILRLDGRTECVARGLPYQIVHELQRKARRSGNVDEHITEDALRQEGIPELEPFRVVSFRSREGGLSGMLLVDQVPDDDRLSLLPEVIRRAAPALVQVADRDRMHRDFNALREEVTQLRNAFDHLPDPVIAPGGPDRGFLTNRRAEELLVSASDDSAGRRHAVERNNLFFSAFQAKALLGANENRELILIDPADGSALLFEVNILEVSQPLGPEEGYVYVLRDITDLKQTTAELENHYVRSVAAEHRVRRESERLNVVLANAGVPILVTNGRSDIVLMNRDAERLVEAWGGASHGTPEVPTNNVKITSLISDFLLQSEQRKEEEVTLMEPGAAGEFPARIVLTKITGPRGEPNAVVCVLHDLTEEREIARLADELRSLNVDLEARVAEATRELSERNRELEDQREQLARASRLKTEFLAMMSHELRTPINSILGFNSLLQEGVLGSLAPEQHHALEKMRAASDHLLSLINDILDLSKVEAGKLSLRPQAVPLTAFLENIAATLAPMAKAKDLEFQLAVEEGIPNVHTDPTRLRQVILNLGSNAVKFTSQGVVELRVGRSDRAGFLRFEMEDTGSGIEDDDLERIFEEFRQVDHFTTREQRGTGLGLAISRKLLALMGGTLSVRSSPGEGSLFWFELLASESALEHVAGRTAGEGSPEIG